MLFMTFHLILELTIKAKIAYPRNRDDSDQINITATQAISKIKQTFPNSQIVVCSILPRKGRGQHLIKMKDV
jgi:hypothetical protein